MEKTLSAEEQRRKVARENFHLTTVSIQHMAVYEPGLFHSGEEHEEGESRVVRRTALSSYGAVPPPPSFSSSLPPPFSSPSCCAAFPSR